MITEPQPHMIVLQLTEALLAQLQPFMVGLDITATRHDEWADQEISAHSHVACYASAEQHTQQLTMAGEVYDALIAHSTTISASSRTSTSRTASSSASAHWN